MVEEWPEQGREHVRLRLTAELLWIGWMLLVAGRVE